MQEIFKETILYYRLMKQVFYNSNGTRYKRALAKQVFYNSNGTRYKRALARIGKKILIAVYDVKTGRSLRQSAVYYMMLSKGRTYDEFRIILYLNSTCVKL